MKIDKLKEIFEDESLKYALATNLAKYGRPQSKKSDKKSTFSSIDFLRSLTCFSRFFSKPLVKVAFLSDFLD